MIDPDEDQSEFKWIPSVLEDVILNKTTPAVVSAMDTMARSIIGPEHLEKLRQLDEIYIRQLRDQCRSGILTRSGGVGVMDSEKERRIRAVFNRGSDILYENRPKQVEYIQIPPDPSLKREDRTLVSMLGAVLGFMVCCTVGLVGRHHGDSIAKTYNNSSFTKIGSILYIV